MTILTHAESGSVYNLGSSEGVQLKELATKVQKSASFSNDIMFLAGSSSSNKGDYMVPSIEKLQKDFNLKITVPLDQAIDRAVKWYLIK